MSGDSFRVLLRVLDLPSTGGINHQRARGGRPLEESHRRDRRIRRRRADHPSGRRRQSGHRRARRLVPGRPGREFLAGEWPERPSLRYLVHWALRRDELCDPGLCPDVPEGGRCDRCPQDKVDTAHTSEAGLLIRRALDSRTALNLGIHIGLADIRADEFFTMLILEDERDRLERERRTSPSNPSTRTSRASSRPLCARRRPPRTESTA